MKTCRLFPLFMVALLSGYGLSASQKQNEAQLQKPEDSEEQAAHLKLIKSPTARYPDEALKGNVEGKVVLSVVVDAQGKVSNVKVLSGPPELVQAAIDSVNQWEFEPPSHAPVVTTAEIGFGHPKECPGPVSEMGEVSSGGWLKSKSGTVIGYDDGSLPPYFTKDRKAGIAGVMLLSISVDAQGKVKKVHIVKSLSPRLDKAAVKTVRTWKFKLIAGNPEALPDDFQLPIIYTATCSPQF
jgi:TonB family protein